MNRRTAVAALGSLTAISLAGCVSSTSNPFVPSGARNDVDVMLYNYTESDIVFKVAVTADGESLVDNMYELDAPDDDSASTSMALTTIREGTTRVGIIATVTGENISFEQTESFEFPQEDEISAIELRAEFDRLRIEPLAFDSPQGL